MTKKELKRLVKIERVIEKYISEELGLTNLPIEFDVIPDQKMIEIMAYRSPSQISNWKFGRDYERLRTIFENTSRGLPYEVVVLGKPCRAYLMNSNVFPANVLVMAHVFGHVAFWTMNKWFKNARLDFLDIMIAARERLLNYERKFGIDDVERTIDGGHALQLHSSPFDNETEKEKRERIYKQRRMQRSREGKSRFRDMHISKSTDVIEHADVDKYNQALKRELRTRVPVEPTEDFLRYIIDNSTELEDFQKDILEVVREEGRFLWPIVRTVFMNEGFAVRVHEKIGQMLFEKKLLSTGEHGIWNYSNSLVKGKHPTQLNPYLVGSTIWKDIEERWDKGQHGYDWLECTSIKEKENWDTGAMEGWKKVLEVMESYTDWFFFQDFFREELVDELELYLWGIEETMVSYDLKRTEHTRKEIQQAIIHSFAHSRVPKIEIVNGKFRGDSILLVHRHTGADLDMRHAIESMKHMCKLTGQTIYLDTIVNGEPRVICVYPKGSFDNLEVKLFEKKKSGRPGESLKPIQSSFSIPDNFASVSPFFKERLDYYNILVNLQK